VRGHRATFRFPRTCRDLASLSIVNKCLVRVELRTPSGRLIGLHSVRLHHGGKATVRVPLKRGVKRKDMAIRLHILGSDRSGDQEALNGGWSVP
jgi:hypothetical protein